MDRIGHRRLQLIGFAMMALCFAVIALVPGMTTVVVPFLLVYGVSYFFTEFGPNMTTFVIPSEVYPVCMRATGHGISAGVGKLGAFIGVFLFPVLQHIAGAARHAPAHRRRVGARLRPHPGAARACRAQSGGDDGHRHCGHECPAAAGGRPGVHDLMILVLDAGWADSIHRAASALMSKADGESAAASLRNAAARPKTSPMVWPASCPLYA